MDVSKAIMEANRVTVDEVRPSTSTRAGRVARHARARRPSSDDWPALDERVLAADILVIGTPIWLGEKSSVART